MDIFSTFFVDAFGKSSLQFALPFSKTGSLNRSSVALLNLSTNTALPGVHLFYLLRCLLLSNSVKCLITFFLSSVSRKLGLQLDL